MRRFFAGLCALTLTTAAAPSAAIEPAPALNMASLRGEASATLAELLRHVPANAETAAQRTGMYAAFDTDAVHPYVLPACDDDGDAVVVLSEAALGLLERVAYASALEEQGYTDFTQRYADFLGQRQSPTARLLPLPLHGLPALDTRSERLATRRFREALGLAVALSLAAFDGGEVACRSPSVAQEHGDRIWTEAERSTGLLSAARLSAERRPLRVVVAIASVLATGQSLQGGRMLARVAERHPWPGPHPLPSPAELDTASASLEAQLERLRRESTPAPSETPRAPVHVPARKARR